MRPTRKPRNSPRATIWRTVSAEHCHRSARISGVNGLFMALPPARRDAHHILGARNHLLAFLRHAPDSTPRCLHTEDCGYGGNTNHIPRCPPSRIGRSASGRSRRKRRLQRPSRSYHRPLRPDHRQNNLVADHSQPSLYSRHLPPLAAIEQMISGFLADASRTYGR